ncbi:MAG: chemotaxis protein CheA [Spirochaetes bacterium]|nr:chemotaxis protein CheA [Spirochaetota bacterium]
MAENTIRDVFLEEAKEILRHLETDLIQLEENPNDDVVHRIFRYVHTIKGSAGISGFEDVYGFAHQLENMLDAVRNKQIPITKPLVDLLLESADWIAEAIYESPDFDRQKLLLEKLESYQISCAEGESKLADERRNTVPSAEIRYFRIHLSFRSNIFENGIDPLAIIEDLVSLGSVENMRVHSEKLPPFMEMDPEKCYLEWTILLKAHCPPKKIEEVFLFVKDDNVISIEDVTDDFAVFEGGKIELKERKIGEILVRRGILTEAELDEVLAIQHKTNKKIGDIIIEKGFADEKSVRQALGDQRKIQTRIQATTVRVETKKLDTLLNLLGEIVISQSSIARIADELEEEHGYRLKNALYGMDRITREFQEQIMAIRMIPIGPTFEQFRRFVRDVAVEVGKEIKLEIRGGETELDKTVIEQINDPLKHMIRNAIDHGIESPLERERCGKNRVGTIVLNAYHQEGNVFIEIIDDGRGIDKEAVRRKAIERGIIKGDEELTDRQLQEIIFLPGFSTATSVGELSGRGVGMDVVRTNIEALRGTVEIYSIPGKGTTFRIKLPLTLAIIEGMIVRVGKNVYIIPLLSIVESLQPKKETLKTVEGKGEVILVRDEYVPLVRLYEHFNIAADCVNPWESLVVVVESGKTKIGIMVDDLVGQQQIVIKSLDHFITKSRALSGAAIMGDGTVALIIDVHGLVGEIVSVGD